MSDATASRDARSTVPRLHVLTADADDHRALGVVDAALAAGAPAIQVRRKGVTDRDHLAFTAEVARRCRDAGATCLVNDRVDVALAARADGVHLGATDLPVAAVRRLVDRPFLVGGTARNAEQARALVAEGADYLGVGPVYRTATKDGLPDPIGLDAVRTVADAVGVPVIAIAGITAARVPELLAAGAHGVAVVGAVADAADPGAATAALLAALGAGP